MEVGEWIELNWLVCDVVHEYQQVQMETCQGTLPPVKRLDDEWSRRKYGCVAMLLTHLVPVRACARVCSALHGPREMERGEIFVEAGHGAEARVSAQAGEDDAS